MGAAIVLAGGWSAGRARANDVPLIPREVLFGNPDRASVRISPDGSRVGFLAAVDGVLNVWVGPREEPGAAKPVTDDTYRGIRMFFWAYNNDQILYIQDKGGDENWHLYSVDLNSKKTIDLTPFDGVAARVQEVSRHHPDEILVAINNRNAQLHDIHRINIRTGDSSLVYENAEGFVGFLTDEHLKLHFGFKVTPDGGTQVLRRTGDEGWSPFTDIPAADSITTSPLMVDKEGKHLYMIDSRGRNTAALTRVNLESGESKLLAEDARADVDNAEVHPTERNVQAVRSTFERSRWQVLDPKIKDDFDALRKVADGDFNIDSRSLDDRFWTVSYEMDAGPVRYYVYDRNEKKAKFLFTNRKSLENYPLARMHPATVKSRDGLNLVCYYTLPTWTDTDQDGRPSEPLPTVLLVHGGPWARDTWGFDGMHQWLANRGYAVLSVNYRGSTGLGKDFVNAGNMEWAGKMHDDLIDAVKWAVKKGIADETKTAIMGGSYGGYATLVGLTYTPEVFACGVDIVGPSNLITLLNSIPPYWKPMMDIFTTRVGDPRTEEGKALLTERSPLHRVEKICKPLLIGQGANDPRVKQAEADQIVEAMEKKNIPVTYVLFPDEGHGFARPANRMSFFAVSEVFLAEHLGGRSESITEAVEASTMLVPTGAEDIPGLPPSIRTRSSKDPT